MSKIDLDPITSGYNLSKINANFQKVEDELNNKVLYRNPPAGEPNSMSSNLDMNSRSILNASKISSNVLELGGVQVVPTSLAVDPYNGTREALRRSYAEAGYNLVDGSFEAGGTLTSLSDVLLLEASGKAFSGAGPFPQAVTAGTNPSSGGFTDKSFALEQMAFASTIAVMIGLPLTVGKIISVGGYFNVMDYSNHKRVIAAADDGTGVQLNNGLWANILHDGSVNLKWFGGVALTDAKVALQKAADYSNAKGVPIVLDAIFYSTAPVLCGSAGVQNYVAFQSPVNPTQHVGQLGGIYFTGCDGFRLVQRTALGLSNLEIFGDGTTAIPSPYGDYLKSLTYSAIRSNEDTMDRNCIAYIKNCRFRKWKYALDFSRGAWSCHFENNNIQYCYQAGKHFRPHSSRFIHNTIGYCIRGFELIEQVAGEFHNNELNTGKYTEYLVKHVKVGTVSCCNNYMEHWEGVPDSVDPTANYGLGFIPIIVEFDRFQSISDAKIDNNLINVPGTYCGILYTPHDSQKTNHSVCPMFKPKGNEIIGATYAKIVVATIGTGDFICDNMSGGVAPYDIKTAQLNGATGKVYFCGAGAMTVYEKEYLTRADILAAVGAVMFGPSDITKDTSFEGGSGGIRHASISNNKIKIRLFVEAKTDATAATFKVTMSKFNAKERTYEYNIPANSTVPIMIEFVQTTPWDAIQEFYFRIQTVTTQPTYLRIHAVKEFISNY